MNQGLPPGWFSVPLGEVVDVHDARRVPVNAEERARRVGPYPYYGANGQAGTIDGYLFDGDFALLAEDGGYFDEPSRGVAYRVTGQFWVNNHAHILAPKFGMSTEFLVRALNAINWMPHVSGTTRLKLTQGAMVKVPFHLPPLNEQRRIVAKLEALQARSRRAREALDAVPPLLDKLRQSILAAAFRGDLTMDWRAKHPDVEPASELLKRIRAERRKKWEEAELAKMKVKGKAPTDDRWKAKYVEPEPVDTAGLPELPEGWAWVSVSEVASIQLGQRRAPEYSNEPHRPYVRAANITWRGLDLSDIKTMGFADPESVSLLPGDVVLNEASGSATEVGKPGLWKGQIPDCCFQATVLRVRAWNPSTVLGRWLFLSFLRNAALGEFAAMAPGVGILHLTSERMRSWPIPIAPLAEQLELSDRVERMLRRVYDVEDGFSVLRDRCNSQDRAILAKAFRGELVPQDPNDEPAETMLARIRGATGSATSADTKPKRRPKARSPVLADAAEE